MSGETTLSRRQFLQATGGAASAVALTGYVGTDESNRVASQETETGQETGTTQEGGTLQLINATMSTLDPIASTDTASGEVIQQIFDAMMNYPNGEIEVETLLAQDYQVSDDFTTYTFQLKEGATYHNGDEVTASDFVYAWERLAASENSQRAYFILESINVVHETDDEGNYVPGSLQVTAEDDYTLTMQLAEPFHSTLPMLAYTSFACYPEGIVGDIEGYDGEMEQSEFATSNPIGCGPFQFESWSPNTEASITRFDDYHGQVASIDGVHWQIIEDDNAVYNYAMNENADIFAIPTSQYDPNKVSIEGTDDLGRQFGTYGPMRNNQTANYLAVSTINSFYIGFNTNNVEKPARQAVAYAANPELLVQQVFKSRGTAAYHFTPPNIFPGGNDRYSSHAQEYPYGYNQSQLDQARQVMEDAGYGPDNRYQFTLTTYESSTWQQIAGILRDQLTSAHIDMQIEQAPFSTLIKRGLNGNLQAYTLGWIMDWPAPDNFLQLLYPPRTDTSTDDAIAYTNWGGTDAAQQAVEAWEQIQNNPQPTDQAESARNEAYIQMEEANWEDVIFLNIYHRTDERFWYDWADVPRFGGAGTSRQMFNQVTLEQRN